MTNRVLITGAAGRLGGFLRARMARPDRTLRLLDTAPVIDPGPGEEVVLGSVTDLDTMTAAGREVDAIVHLAGIPTEAAWAELLDVNIDGTRTVLEAARLSGVGRVVLASSNHAVGFYPRGPQPLASTLPPRPDTYYGVSKAAMEALGSLYADRFGLSVTSLRIGSCFERPVDARALSTWLSPDDLANLVEAALRAGPGHRIVWGVSANTRRWWSLAEAEELGYRSTSDAEAYAADDLTASPHDDLVGGAFVAKPLGESS